LKSGPKKSRKSRAFCNIVEVSMANPMTTEKRPWPTLEGRLRHPLTSRAEGLRQFQITMPLSASAQKELRQSSAASFSGPKRTEN
jgi:hypothetical protein